MPHEIQATTPAGTSPILTRRVTGNDGLPILAAGITTITYSIWRLNEDDESKEPVFGHQAVALTPVASYVFDQLQLDELWKVPSGEYVDNVGYNFRHQPSNATNLAFPEAWQVYLIKYEFTPASGQKFQAPFRVATT